MDLRLYLLFAQKQNKKVQQWILSIFLMVMEFESASQPQHVSYRKFYFTNYVQNPLQIVTRL